MHSTEFNLLESKIDYQFNNRNLLESALTHRSHAREDLAGERLDNESLEFLGDAVIGFVISDLLFRLFPDYSEGQKSKIKAWIVSASVLTRLGEVLDLGNYLLLGKGEEKTGGRKKPALIANTFEALVAAIYLDGGIKAVQNFIEQQFSDLIKEIQRKGPDFLDVNHKSTLQEWLQFREIPLPEYKLSAESGPDHNKIFEVDIWIKGRKFAQGTGQSKKEAEQAAAQNALRKILKK